MERICPLDSICSNTCTEAEVLLKQASRFHGDAGHAEIHPAARSGPRVPLPELGLALLALEIRVFALLAFGKSDCDETS